MGNFEVQQTLAGVNLSLDKVVTTKPIKLNFATLRAFEVPHDVFCQGFTLKTKHFGNIIYVTDSAGTKKWPKGKYRYLFIESNHDEKKLAMVDEKKYYYGVINNSRRHTSTQESRAFYYLNREDKESEWIELHKSQRFY